jgi:hypothetical protein
MVASGAGLLACRVLPFTVRLASGRSAGSRAVLAWLGAAARAAPLAPPARQVDRESARLPARSRPDGAAPFAGRRATAWTPHPELFLGVRAPARVRSETRHGAFPAGICPARLPVSAPLANVLEWRVARNADGGQPWWRWKALANCAGWL